MRLPKTPKQSAALGVESFRAPSKIDYPLYRVDGEADYEGDEDHCFADLDRIDLYQGEPILNWCDRHRASGGAHYY